MMSELTPKNEQTFWILAYCAETGEEVVGKVSNEPIATSDKEGIWWFCPACKGWHVSIVKDKASIDNSEACAFPNPPHRPRVRSDSHKLKTFHHKENPFVELLSPFNSHSSIYWAY